MKKWLKQFGKKDLRTLCTAKFAEQIHGFKTNAEIQKQIVSDGTCSVSGVPDETRL